MKKFIIHFTYIFLIVFILDGIVSLLDNFSIYFTKDTFTGSIGSFLFYLSLICGFVTLILSNVFYVLPKLILFPALIYPYLYIFGFIPFVFITRKFIFKMFGFNYFVLIGSREINTLSGVLICLVQILLGLYTVYRLNNFDFEKRRLFSKRRVVMFISFNLLTIMFVTPFLILINMFTIINGFSNNYIKLKKDGIYAVNKIYEKNNKQVYIIPNIYSFSEVSALKGMNMVPEDTHFFIENISDDEGKLYSFKKRNIVKYALGFNDVSSFFKDNNKKYSNETFNTKFFSKNTIKHLNNVFKFSDSFSDIGELIKGITSIRESMRKDNAWHSFINDLVIKRGSYFYSSINSLMSKNDSIAVFWGPLYVDEIEKLLINSGFYYKNKIEYKLIEYDKGYKNAFSGR